MLVVQAGILILIAELPPYPWKIHISISKFRISYFKFHISYFSFLQSYLSFYVLCFYYLFNQVCVFPPFKFHTSLSKFDIYIGLFSISFKFPIYFYLSNDLLTIPHVFLKQFRDLFASSQHCLSSTFKKNVNHSIFGNILTANIVGFGIRWRVVKQIVR